MASDLYNNQAMRAQKSLSRTKQYEQKEQPLLSSHLQSPPQNQQIDVINLISKQQQSRVSKVNLNFYQSTKRERKSIEVLKQSTKLIMNEQQLQVKECKQTFEKQKNWQNRNTQHQSFLSSYQGNSFVGVLLYIAFMVLISVQILVSTYFASNCLGGQLCKTRGVLLILSSELFYYLLARCFNNKMNNKLFKDSSIQLSVKKLLSESKYCKYYKDQRFFLIKYVSQRPYLLLSIIIVTIICSEMLYCWLATQSAFLFKIGGNYLLPTIYWSNFVLPILVNNFYMNRKWDDKSSKINLFPLLLLGFMLETIFQSVIFFILSSFKALYCCLRTKQGLEMFHIDQIAKGVLLIIWLAMGCIQVLNSGFQMRISVNTVLSIGQFCFQVAIITISFILTRLVALVFIKQLLHRRFYTENHLHAAFIVVNIMMYAAYLRFSDQERQTDLLHCILAVSFLILIGILIYLQGKQQEELKIQTNIID